MMSGVNADLVRIRMAARAKAAETVECLKLEASEIDAKAVDAYWAVIQEAAVSQLPQPEVKAKHGEAPFTHEQAKAFGAEVMKFGKYEGKRIDDIPLNYIVMLLYDNEFKVKLRRYLNSPRIKQELEVME